MLMSPDASSTGTGNRKCDVGSKKSEHKWSARQRHMIDTGVTGNVSSCPLVTQSPKTHFNRRNLLKGCSNH